MTPFRTLDDFDPAGKIILFRADLNVPMQDGQVTDATRLTRLAPTVRELAARGGRIVVLSHFGRPKGHDPSQSLAPLAPALAAALGRPVGFCPDCCGPAAERAAAALANGDILLCENLRFHPEEEKNDPVFAAALARLGHIYVNDAFSAAHRAHASTEGLAHCLPAYAGRLMQAELSALDAALEHPVRPVVGVVGGSKISTKLDVLNHLVTRLDVLVLGGGMANTFLYAEGKSVGASLCEKDLADTARGIAARAAASGCRLLLPVDAVVAREFRAQAPSVACPVGAIPEDGLMLDLGPASVAAIVDVLRRAKTLLWNGPLGAFETPPFHAATAAVAKMAAALTKNGDLISVAGGGDTVAALAQAGVENDFTYVSTAGGAFLEWLEGKDLPGVRALISA